MVDPAFVRINLDPGWQRVLYRINMRKLDQAATIAVYTARQLCPVSEGPNEPGHRHMRDRIQRSEVGESADDGGAPYIDILSPADYTTFVEFGTRPHIIESHGNYPLRNKWTGQVFGRRVHHPGTRDQPFMRPALEALRGRIL